MKRTIISLLTLTTFLTTRPTYADAAPQEELSEASLQLDAPKGLIADSIDDDVDDEGVSEPQGKEVGQASNEAAKAARRKQLQNIGLAIGAVAVAVTALILVNNNQGHHSSSQ